MNNNILKLENNDFKVEYFEKCVICNNETKTPVDLHVDRRNFYINGVGELCEQCFEIYEK